MKRIWVLMAIALASLLPITLGAHDASKHKGKAITGEIISLGDDRFELKTDAGKAAVTFSSKTKFEHDGKPVDKTHLQKGERVSVIGTKLPSGEIVAREVLMGTDASHKASAQKSGKTAEKKTDPHADHKQ